MRVRSCLFLQGQCVLQSVGLLLLRFSFLSRQSQSICQNSAPNCIIWSRHLLPRPPPPREAFFLSLHSEHSCGTRRMGRARAGVKNAVIEKWAQRLGVCSSDRPRPTDRLSDLTRTRYDTDIAFPSFVSCLLLASEGVYSAASRRGMPSIWGNKLCVGPRIGGNCLRVLTIPRPTLSGLSLSQSPIRLS